EERSPVLKEVYRMILEKFERIRRMKFNLLSGRRLYFFQKYCLYETQALRAEGVQGVLHALDAGLGKTLLALLVVQMDKQLILTPNAVVSTWPEQEEKFLTQALLDLLTGPYRERRLALTRLTRPHVVTNIGYMRDMDPRLGELISRRTDVLVVDEADY